MVIRLAVFILSAGWGLVSGGLYYSLHRNNALEATPGLNASILGASAFVITLFVLVRDCTRGCSSRLGRRRRRREAG